MEEEEDDDTSDAEPSSRSTTTSSSGFCFCFCPLLFSLGGGSGTGATRATAERETRAADEAFAVADVDDVVAVVTAAAVAVASIITAPGSSGLPATTWSHRCASEGDKRSIEYLATAAESSLFWLSSKKKRDRSADLGGAGQALVLLQSSGRGSVAFVSFL